MRRKLLSIESKCCERRGKFTLYYCTTCHQEKGEGIETVYPPLAKSIT